MDAKPASSQRPNARDLEDAQLLQRVAQGDVDAMKTLYDRHVDAVGRFVRARVRDEVEAADIVHDTMLRVWRGAAGFEGRSSVLTWIMTLARNRAVDHMRKQARVTYGAPDDTLPDPAPDPEKVLGAAQEAQRLRDCVQALPEHQRAAIHLAYFQDMSCAQIAGVENVPEGTVKSRIYHAKQLLMRCLGRGGAK